jgi:hypothetical protein
LARGASYHQAASRPFRTASLDHIQCGHLECTPEERTIGANLGLYSVTFNNDVDRDLATLERFHDFREEAERKAFRYFLEVFDPNLPGAVAGSVLPQYINDMITRMLAGIGPAGRPLFLKVVYHGARALEELVGFDPHLVVGILGGSAGTTRDAFQLLHDAQKYGAKVALFGRKINHAENQLAFVAFLRLIVEGQIGPVEAVRAYHAVLAKLGLRPHRSLDDDLKVTDQSMSYAASSSSVATGAGLALAPRVSAGGAPPVAAWRGPARDGNPLVRPETPLTQSMTSPCHCQSQSAGQNGAMGKCACERQRPLVTESHAVSHPNHVSSRGPARSSGGGPDFARMSPAERLAYHRQRLGLGG